MDCTRIETLARRTGHGGALGPFGFGKITTERTWESSAKCSFLRWIFKYIDVIVNMNHSGLNIFARAPILVAFIAIQCFPARCGLSKKPITFSYVFFYALFWPDTWQMLAGLLVAWLLTPRLAPADVGVAGAVLLYGMLAVIGYAASGIVLRPLFRRLHARMLRRSRT
jgi:hypothetical protein